MNRGDVYFAHLGDEKVIGSEQAGDRTVIIVQNDILSRYSSTVVIIPTTGNIERASIPGCILLNRGEGGLSIDSIALCFQIRAISIKRLKNKLGTLSTKKMKEIEAGIKTTLNLV